jgi:hypothetical protein
VAIYFHIFRMHAILIFSVPATWHSHLIFLNSVTLITSGENYKLHFSQNFRYIWHQIFSMTFNF